MTPARILVVEDDRVVARDIQQQLKRIGHQIVGTTARGEEAVDLALESQPDLILMDIRLEGALDGIDAARQIRESCHVPVVFLTAYADDETVRRASQSEPFGYLLKPFEDSQLRTVIEMALYKHSAERKLRESERLYAATLSSIGEAVIATDKLANITFLNPVAEALTGWVRADAIGHHITVVYHTISEESRDPVENPVVRALQSGAAAGLPAHTVLLARDGRELPIDDSASPIIDEHGEICGAVLVFRDLTHRNQVEDRLRVAHEMLVRAGRLTSMGELTVSIAHEVTQPLMAIVTNAATCLRWLGDSQFNVDEARRAAERIVRDGHRAGDVIASIRSLAQKSTPARVQLDLHEAVLEVLALMRNELRRNGVSTETELSPEVGLVLADRVQLQQVVLNLIMNGVEAMRTAPAPLRHLQICTHRADLEHVLVTIADAGGGIDPANSERVFDAFFTTKPEGLGIGLSICRSIVEAHGGRLWASPNEPRGSIFSFTLPTAHQNGSNGPLD